MNILTYKAHNIGRLTDIDLTLEGSHLYRVGGLNGVGKTSAVINGVRAVLCGRSGMDYPDPLLKEGEKSGWIAVTLSGDAELHEDDHLKVELHELRLTVSTKFHRAYMRRAGALRSSTASVNPVALIFFVACTARWSNASATPWPRLACATPT